MTPRRAAACLLLALLATTTLAEAPPAVPGTTAPEQAAAVGTEPVSAPTLNGILKAAELRNYRKALNDGELVWLSAPDNEAESSAVAGIMMARYRASMAEVIHVMATDTELADSLAATIDAGSPASIAHSFQDVRLDPGDTRDIQFLLSPHPSGNFNYSAAEIQRLEELAAKARHRTPAPGDAELASELMRDLLQRRFLAYRGGGMAAIADYQRPLDTVTRPGLNLEAATDSYRLMAQYFPAFYSAVKQWPQGPQKGYVQLHSWYQDRQGGRPMFALKHAILDITDDYAVIIERQYYLSQTLDNLQVTMLLLPDGDHSVLTILTQTSTARVEGVGRLIAVPIGRYMVRRNVEPIFTTLRQHFGE